MASIRVAKTVYPKSPANNFQEWVNEVFKKNEESKGFDKAIKEHHFKFLTKNILKPL